MNIESPVYWTRPWRFFDTASGQTVTLYVESESEAEYLAARYGWKSLGARDEFTAEKPNAIAALAMRIADTVERHDHATNLIFAAIVAFAFGVAAALLAVDANSLTAPIDVCSRLIGGNELRGLAQADRAFYFNARSNP